MLGVLRRLFSFSDWSQHHPAEPPPGDMLDASFDAQNTRILELEALFTAFRREDGQLRNGIVTKDSLNPEIYGELRHEMRLAAHEERKKAEKDAEIAQKAAENALNAQTRAESAEISARADANVISTARNSQIAQISNLIQRSEQLLAVLREVEAGQTSSESHAGYSEAWAISSALWAEHMPDTLPDNALKVMDVTGDHWSAKWWANRADNAFGRLTDLYLGAWPSPPSTNLEGGPITVGSIYYDTSTGQMYVWDGSGWQSMSQPARAAIMALWYSATEGQTAFPLNVPDLNGQTFTIDSTAPESIDAHVNGVKTMQKQAASDGDWALSGSTVTFLRPLRLGDIVSFDILMNNSKLGPGAVNSWSLSLVEAKDGTRATFTLVMEDVSGPAVTVNKNEELLVSLDGVIQEPGISYSASGSSISFMTAPASDSWVFITWFRSEGGTGILAAETVDWADITGKPATFPPTLPIAQSGVTNLTTDLTARVLKAGDTMTGDLIITKTAPFINLDKTAGNEGALAFRTGTSNRWRWVSSSDAESANNGSHLRLMRYNDAGTKQDEPIVVNRLNGSISLNAAVVINSSLGLTNSVSARNATAIPAGGTTGFGYQFSSTANFGVFFGSGVPTLSAAQGSLYLRSDGTGTNTRVYVNTNGTTGWAAMSVIAVGTSAPSSPATNDVWIDTT